MEWVKQYKNDLQNEKNKIISIAFKQWKILHQLKESEEFIDILVKRLKMRKVPLRLK